MVTLAVDYSVSRPDPKVIAAQGFVGVLRYAGGSSAKHLTAPELKALHAEGLAVALVWESTADRAGQGRQAGLQDAKSANQVADTLGFPVDRPIFYAVDFDADPAKVLPYFQGVGAGGGRRVGVYGSYRVVEAVAGEGLASFVWQCAAWSHGKRSARAHLFQYARTPKIAGTDENEVLAADWGAWAPPATKPTPTPPAPPEDDDMPKGHYVQKGGDVYLAGLAFQPRHVSNFVTTEAVAASEGLTIVAPPDGSPTVRDGQGTERKVWAVDAVGLALFGLG